MTAPGADARTHMCSFVACVVAPCQLALAMTAFVEGDDDDGSRRRRKDSDVQLFLSY